MNSIHLTVTTLYTAACLVWAFGFVITLISDVTKIQIKDKFFSFVMMAGGITAIAGAVKGFCYKELFGYQIFPNFGLAPLSCQSDTLTGPFILLMGVITTTSALACPSYTSGLATKNERNLFYKLIFLLLLGTFLSFISANAIAFLVCFEVMSLSTAGLIASDHIRHRAQRAAFSYITASRIATALLTAAFLWMQHISGSFNFDAWHFESSRTLPAALMIFIGVAIKAGLWPTHVYLPQSYAEAPGPATALISGLVSKVSIYLMLRLIVLGDCHSPYVIYAALALGLISSVWGVLFALVERDIKRLLAYSSVENMGLIMVGIALAMLSKHYGLPGIAAIAVTGVIFHTVNHGLFKSLLMLGAASIEKATHTRELSQLGGLARRMPWTMLGFFVGGMAICAMPPTNGFASKWLIYQGFFQLSFAQVPLFDRAIAMAVIGSLAFVGALSLACYAKAIGIAFLGRARSTAAKAADEGASGKLTGLTLAQLILAVICIILGTSASVCMHGLSPVLAYLTGSYADPASLFPIPQGQLCLVGLILASSIYILVLGPKTQSINTYITWDCGYGPLSARAEETGSSFSHPIGRIFAQILQLDMVTTIDGKDRRHFPEQIRVETKMSPYLETRAYRRTLDLISWLSLTMTRLQTGSIHVHLLYVFLTMLFLVLLGITL